MFADLSLLTLIQRVIAAVIIAGVHGLALAGIARWLGDRTPQYDGRLSLSPLKHLSVLGLLSALATRAGWIVPIDLDPAQMRFGRWGLVICVLASLVLLVVFGLLVLMLRLPLLGLISQRAAMYIIPSLQVLGEMAIFYALLNLTPLPPMTGAHLLRAASAAKAKQKRRTQFTTWQFDKWQKQIENTNTKPNPFGKRHRDTKGDRTRQQQAHSSIENPSVIILAQDGSIRLNSLSHLSS